MPTYPSDSMIGEGRYALGPGRAYLDSVSGGDNVDLGPTTGITWSIDQGWYGHRSADAGDVDDEMSSTFTRWTLTMGLVKPNWNAILMLFPGIKGHFNSANELVYVYGVNSRGWSTEDHRYQLTFKEYDRDTNAITVNPWRIVDFWSVAPAPETTQLVWNASEQRALQIRLMCKETESQLGPDGEATAWKIRGDS